LNLHLRDQPQQVIVRSCPRQYFQVNIPSVADAQYPDLGAGDSINDPVIADPQLELWVRGYDVGRDRVRHLMRRMGIEALYAKAFFHQRGFLCDPRVPTM